MTNAMLTAEFWIDKIGTSATQDLLNEHGRTAANDHARSLGFGIRTLPAKLDEDAQKKQSPAFHLEQQAYVHQQLESGRFLESQPGATQRGDARVSTLVPRDDYFRLVESIGIRCWPIEGSLYRDPPDVSFDRNNCTALHPPELVHRIASDTENQWHYIQGEFVEGWVSFPRWIAVDAEDETRRQARSRFFVPRDHMTLQLDDRENKISLRLGSQIPSDPNGAPQWPTFTGWTSGRFISDNAIGNTPLPLRRDELLQAAFSLLNDPYGWGGYRGGRDCSRYLLDLLRRHGLELPRFSGHQAMAGNINFDVSEFSEVDKRARMRELARDHVVLLFMPGHIMLYLGAATSPEPIADAHLLDGQNDYALSAISEFVTPCEHEDEEQVYRLDRVTVTDLELGRGAKRRSFIERITHLVAFGASEAPADRPHP